MTGRRRGVHWKGAALEEQAKADTPAQLDQRSKDSYTGRQLTHYQTLGVSSDAKHDAIRGAYRSLAVKHHPDKGGDPLLFQAIQEAYDVLSDEKKRRAYNAAFRKKPVESLATTATGMVDEFLAAC